MGYKSTRDFSKKQEKCVADYLGWSVVSASGAISTMPGDVQGRDWLGECKTHIEKDHPICFKADVWSKLRTEAVYKHRFPVLIVDDGSQDIHKTWAMFSQLVQVKNLHIHKFPITVRTNVSFNHEKLVCDFLSKYDPSLNFYTVYEVKINGEFVYVTRLDEFKEMFCR